VTVAAIVSHFSDPDTDDFAGTYFGGHNAEHNALNRYCDWWRDESMMTEGARQPVYLFHHYGDGGPWHLVDCWLGHN
jgi:hypothetical protein